MDSNHRTPKRAELQSAAIATMRRWLIIVPSTGLEPVNPKTLDPKSNVSTIFHHEGIIEPPIGFEPTTRTLQMYCSTN